MTWLLTLILVLITSVAQASCPSGTCYMSPTGGATAACTAGDPCSWAGVDAVDSGAGPDADDVVILTDGTYKRTTGHYILNLSADDSGTAGHPVIIKAQNPGSVFLDGELLYGPVNLSGVSYVEFQDLNACCADAAAAAYGRVYMVWDSNDITFRRCIGWDGGGTGVGNYIFDVETSAADKTAYNILYEDCAGWGRARKIFQSYSNEVCTASPCDTSAITYRRCFFRWTAMGVNDWANGMTLGYESAPVLIENCIGTWDEYGDEVTHTVAMRDAVFGSDGIPPTSGSKVLGSIGYILASQTSSVEEIFCFAASGVSATAAITMRDIIAYTDRNNVATIDPIGINMDDRAAVGPTYTLEYGTIIGGPTGDPADETLNQAMTVGVPSANIQYLIVANAPEVTFDNCASVDYVDFYNESTLCSSGSIPNSVDALPGYTGTSNLTYSQSVRPVVGANSVGAQIKYRYVDGVLTSTLLWPWPMDARIAAAMASQYNRFCADHSDCSANTDTYAAHGGVNGVGGLSVTDTVFALGGGGVPGTCTLSTSGTGSATLGAAGTGSMTLQ